MKLIILSLTFALFSGCATVRESYSQTGQKSYALNCSGTARGWDKCFAAAGEKCGARGYIILDRNGERMSAGGGSSGAWSFAETQERTMLIQCK